MLAANFNSGPYRVVLILHILSAVVGFGGLFLDGLRARRALALGGPEGAAVLREQQFISNRVAEMGVYGTVVFGVVAIMLDDRWEFSQGWVSMAFVLYVAAVGLQHAIIRPTTAALGDALGAGATEAGAVEQKLMRFSAVSNLLVTLAIIVMVWKPGL